MFSPNIATAKRGESDAGIGMKHENNERELLGTAGLRQASEVVRFWVPERENMEQNSRMEGTYVVACEEGGDDERWWRKPSRMGC